MLHTIFARLGCYACTYTTDIWYGTLLVMSVVCKCQGHTLQTEWMPTASDRMDAHADATAAWRWCMREASDHHSCKRNGR
eukprot:2589446-Rhodomonas_salina.3